MTIKEAKEKLINDNTIVAITATDKNGTDFVLQYESDGFLLMRDTGKQSNLYWTSLTLENTLKKENIDLLPENVNWLEESEELFDIRFKIWCTYSIKDADWKYKLKGVTL